jgi:hypothetical protein
MTIPPQAADRLAKLLRSALSLAGAQHSDSEAANALRAIKNMLENSGSDLHAFADAVAKLAGTNGKALKFSEEDALEIYRSGREEGERIGRASAQRERGASFVSVDQPTWNEIAVACQGRPDVFKSDRESEFVDDMVRRTVHGGEPSEKQGAWLRKIYARL